MPIPQSTVLDNGTVVLVVENNAVDLVSAKFFIKYGTQMETPEQAGLVHLVSSLLTKGTSNFSAQEIAEQVECMGASLSAEANSDYLLISLKAIASDFPSLLKLSAEILRSPSFPQSEIALERHLTIQAIKSQQERPFAIGYDRLQSLLFGQHSYGLPILGFEHTVAQLSQSDLQAYHQQYVQPQNLVVSIAGKISSDQAVQLVAEVLGDWQSVNPSLPSVDPPQVQTPSAARISQNNQQAIVMLGYPAVAVNSGDYPAMKLISTYLGSGLSSRLFVELREKRGLAYEVSAFYPTRQLASLLVAYMGTANSNVEIALEGLQAECDRLAQQPLNAEELKLAKSKLLGQYALGKQTNSQLAQAYGWYECLGLGADFDQEFVRQVEVVSAESVQAVAQACFQQPAIVVVG